VRLIRRNLTLLYGFAVLLWLQVEDNRVITVVLFGLGLSMLIAWHKASRLLRRVSLIEAALLGAIVGAGTALTTGGLMLLKTGMHSHIYPDYPPAQMIAILSRLPVWALAGGLAGLGLALARRARHDKPNT
jgi:hypothetical protein